MMILAADLAKDWGINISQIPLCRLRTGMDV